MSENFDVFSGQGCVQKTETQSISIHNNRSSKPASHHWAAKLSLLGTSLKMFAAENILDESMVKMQNSVVNCPISETLHSFFYFKNNVGWKI
jgi:hypothetical protein